MPRPLCLLCLLVACTTEAPPASSDAYPVDTSASDGPGHTDVVSPGDDTDAFDYGSATYAERYTYMEDVVLPVMQAVFVRERPEYVDMTCLTCHGEDAEEVAYVMPNGLYPFTATENAVPTEFSSDEEEAWAMLMIQVADQMAALVGRTFDLDSPMKGDFTCFSCHVEGSPEEEESPHEVTGQEPGALREGPAGDPAPWSAWGADAAAPTPLEPGGSKLR